MKEVYLEAVGPTTYEIDVTQQPLLKWNWTRYTYCYEAVVNLHELDQRVFTIYVNSVLDDKILKIVQNNHITIRYWWQNSMIIYMYQTFGKSCYKYFNYRVIPMFSINYIILYYFLLTNVSFVVQKYYTF